MSNNEIFCCFPIHLLFIVLAQLAFSAHRISTRLSRRLNNSICKPDIRRKIVRDIKWCVFSPNPIRDLRQSCVMIEMCSIGENACCYLSTYVINPDCLCPKTLLTSLFMVRSLPAQYLSLIKTLPRHKGLSIPHYLCLGHYIPLTCPQ